MKRLQILFAFALAMGASYAAQGKFVVETGCATHAQTVALISSEPISDAMVARVIHAAAAWGMDNFGLSEAQMLQKYEAGTLGIELVSFTGTSWTFKVTCGGVAITSIIDEY
jgi:hypothetical protein